MKNENGFTLIGLLVVTAIIGTLAAVFVPGLLSRKETRFVPQGTMQERVHQKRLELVQEPAVVQDFPGRHTAVTDSIEIAPGTYTVSFERAPDVEGAEAFPFTGITASADIHKGDVLEVAGVAYNEGISGRRGQFLLVTKKH